MKQLTRSVALQALNVYKEAWEKQDPNRILDVFTSDAVYHERVFEKPYKGHAEIKSYWIAKVVNGQSDITCDLLNVYLDGDTAIAEWEARFFDREKNLRTRLREVAILEFRGTKIAALREYWASEHMDTRS